MRNRHLPRICRHCQAPMASDRAPVPVAAAVAAVR